MPNMGYFFISPYKTETLIDRMFQSMHNRESGKNPEGMTRDDVKEKLKKYWPFHEHARHHHIRTGKRFRREEKLKLLRANGDEEQLQAFYKRRKRERPEGT